MSPSKVSRRVFLDRVAWVDRMVDQIRALPLGSQEAFAADSRNVWTAESCLRRARATREALRQWFDSHQQLVDDSV